MLLFIPMLLFIEVTLVSRGARGLWTEKSMLLFIHVTFREWAVATPLCSGIHDGRYPDFVDLPCIGL